MQNCSILFISALGIMLAAPASANDSLAAIGVGGLVFEKTYAIRMLREDLRITRHQISVDYLFENITDQPITALVGFPLPPYDGEPDELYKHAVDLAAPLQPFETWVDGRITPASPHMRVMLDGTDITAILAPFGFVPAAYADIPDKSTVEAQRDALDAAGAQAGVPDLGRRSDAWTFELVYLWTLEIEAQAQSIVRHRYRPLYGGEQIFPLAAGSDDHVRARYEEDYCADTAQWQAIRDSASQDLDGYAGMIAQVSYILTTGANWADPIGHFTLAIEAEEPGSFPMMCWRGAAIDGVREAWRDEISGFTPGAEIAVAFFVPATSPD